MRILQVIPTLGLAGAERMLEALSIELTRLGEDVRVVDLYDEETPITCSLEAHGIEVRHLGKRSGFDARMYPLICRELAAWKPDVMHTHRYAVQYAVPVAAWSRRLVRVHTVHSLAEKELGRQAQAICAHYYRRKKLVPVGINDSVAASIATRYGMPETDVPTICNGIPKPAVASTARKGSPCTFLHVGRYSEEKNHAGLIEGFRRFHARHPETRLLLAGTGPLFDAVREDIERAGAQGYIEQLGACEDMDAVYARADAFVLPSLYEGMSMSIIEAMMRGLPVLASDRGGTPDLVKDGETGYLCEPDASSIEAGFERLCSDEGRELVARRGASSVERYSAANMAAKYLELYDGLRLFS